MVGGRKREREREREREERQAVTKKIFDQKCFTRISAISTNCLIFREKKENVLCLQEKSFENIIG